MKTVDTALHQIRKHTIRIVLYVVDDRNPIKEGDNCVYHINVRFTTKFDVIYRMERFPPH